jgi:hypothetical protein
MEMVEMDLPPLKIIKLRPYTCKRKQVRGMCVGGGREVPPAHIGMPLFCEMILVKKLEL